MLEGLFKGLLGPGRRPVRDESASEGLCALLHGRHSYPFEVVETARFQSELGNFATKAGCALRRSHHIAVLKTERLDERGKVRVAVRIDGTLVGYLPGYLSTQYQEWLHIWNLGRARVYCRVLILTANGDSGLGYRVKLDLEIPFKMTTVMS